MKTKTVICDVCGKEFQRRTGDVNKAIKLGRKQFCSSDCFSLDHDKKETRKCTYCGKEIKIKQNEIKRSESGHFFCNKSCGAHFNNIGRVISPQQRIKIANTLNTYYKKQGVNREIKQCIICNKSFTLIRPTQKCCSRDCNSVYQSGSLPYTKEEMENKILELAKNENRTPIQEGVERKLVNAAKKYFGSWNKTMIHLGLEPNPCYTQHKKKKLIAKDGHRIDSISELIIDNWLTEHNIKHERNKLYGVGKTSCDFYLPDYNVWVEYFGLMKSYTYIEKMMEKKEIAKQKGYELIEIYPKDLYPDRKLNELLGKFVKTPIENKV